MGARRIGRLGAAACGFALVTLALFTLGAGANAAAPERFVVSKGCDREATYAQWQAKAVPAIVRCHERHNDGGAGLNFGRYELTWTIGVDGRVTAVKTRRATIRKRAPLACVRQVMRKTVFAAPKAGRCRARMTLVFKPGD